MSCKIEDKPKEIPRFYTTHGILPSHKNDWVCKNNEWIWEITIQENEEIRKIEKIQEKLPYTAPTRNMYSTIVIEGKRYTVWVDSKYGDYVVINGKHYKLRTDWFKILEFRQHGEKALNGEIPRKSIEDVFKRPSLLDIFSLPDKPSLPKLPSLNGIKTDLQLSIIFVVAIVLIIVYMLTGGGKKGVTVVT